LGGGTTEEPKCCWVVEKGKRHIRADSLLKGGRGNKEIAFANLATENAKKKNGINKEESYSHWKGKMGFYRRQGQKKGKFENQKEKSKEG